VLGGNLNFQRIIGSGSLQFSESKNRHPFQFFGKFLELMNCRFRLFEKTLRNRYGFHERVGKEPVLSHANSLIF